MVVQNKSSGGLDPHVLPHEESVGKTRGRSRGLFASIEEQDWAAAISRCKAFPEEAKIWFEQRLSDGSFKVRRLPLHDACARNPPKEIIDALLEAFHQASRKEDQHGRLALHIACNHGASQAAVMKIISFYPDAINKKDNFDKTPLSGIKFSSNPDRDAIIEALHKGPFHYHQENHKAKWIKDIDEKVSKLEKSHHSEIKIESVHDETSMMYSVESRIANLTAQVNLDVSMRSPQILSSNDTKKYLEKRISDIEENLTDARMKFTLADEELCCIIKSEREFEAKVKTITAMLQESDASHAVTREEEKVVQEENAALREKQRMQVDLEKSLETEIEVLTAALIDAEGDHVAAKEGKEAMEAERGNIQSIFQEKIDMVNEIESLLNDVISPLGDTPPDATVETSTIKEKPEIIKLKVSQLASEKVELEEKLKECNLEMTAIERATADAFMKSEGIIDTLMQKLANSSESNRIESAKHKDEKKRMESTINESKTKIQTFDDIIKVAEKERDEVLETLNNLKGAINILSTGQEFVVGSIAVQQKRLQHAFEAHAEIIEAAAQRELEIKSAVAQHKQMTDEIGKHISAIENALS